MNIEWVRPAGWLRSHSTDIYIDYKSSADTAKICSQRSAALRKQKAISNAGSKKTQENGEPTLRKHKTTWSCFTASWWS